MKVSGELPFGAFGVGSTPQPAPTVSPVISAALTKSVLAKIQSFSCLNNLPARPTANPRARPDEFDAQRNRSIANGTRRL